MGTVEPRLPPGEDARFWPAQDGGVPACRGNNDGVITRDEVVFAPGVEVRYRMNPPGTVAAVNVAGETRADGTRVWDFSESAGEVFALSLARAQDLWVAQDFPTAQYAARLDPREGTVGVYRATDTALELLGAASETADGATRLRYDTPIALLRFPLSPGGQWSAEAMTVDGTVGGTPVASRDRYDVSVDAAGELRLGVITFRNTVRIRVEVTQQFPAGMGVRRIQYLWMAECYGEVARVTSREGEVNPEFTEANEFRRLAL